MKKILLFLLCLCSLHAIAQTDSLHAVADITAFQKNLDEEFRNREESPLDAEDFIEFKGHDFFPIDLDYRVNAKLTVTQGTPFFAMKTTTTRVSTERVYGYVTFAIGGKEFRLPVYQSKDLMQNKEYADYLFFPFTDETNGKQTYAGGRYIDLRIPQDGDNIVVDFNMAYNPYCAYSSRFSCPLVPEENQMDIEVPVGVKYVNNKKVKRPDFTPGDSKDIDKLDEQPEYPGGFEAMMRFIKKNMKYPKAAVKQKLQGTVYVQFIVDRDGSVTDIRTLKGLSDECDKEAERVVSLMPKWKPGRLNGKNVAVRYVMPLKFKGRPSWDRQ